MSQTYVKIPSGNIGLHQPQVEPWHQRGERERLARSHPGPSGAERAVEQALLEQVSGKAMPAAQPSVQLQSDWQKLQASLNRQRLLEEKLFSQVAASYVPLEDE